jgi:pyridoxal phosphate enzyme (YggS family)
MSIEKNLEEVKRHIPNSVQLVAVSKTKPNEDIEAAYAAGQRHFGENKVQDMADKAAALPKDIKWHMIGHVQRNKIKYMADFVHLIHGVDSLKTLLEINKQAAKHNRVISVLLQVKIAQEDSKFGIETKLLEGFIEDLKDLELSNVDIRGLMGMASFTSDEEQIRKEFAILKHKFDLNQNKFAHFDTLSMGMSGDYQIAISEGSNLVRVGSAIFGARNYH